MAENLLLAIESKVPEGRLKQLITDVTNRSEINSLGRLLSAAIKANYDKSVLELLIEHGTGEKKKGGDLSEVLVSAIEAKYDVSLLDLLISRGANVNKGGDTCDTLRL